jgi:hypothetical protein
VVAEGLSIRGRGSPSLTRLGFLMERTTGDGARAAPSRAAYHAVPIAYAIGLPGGGTRPHRLREWAPWRKEAWQRATLGWKEKSGASDPTGAPCHWTCGSGARRPHARTMVGDPTLVFQECGSWPRPKPLPRHNGNAHAVPNPNVFFSRVSRGVALSRRVQ